MVALPVATGSSRICAMQFSNNNIKLLCICVYMPYEKDVSSLEEFQFQLSVIDSLTEQYSDCHVIVSGDFNVDFMRNWCHTDVLDDFCTLVHSFKFISCYSTY